MLYFRKSTGDGYMESFCSGQDLSAQRNLARRFALLFYSLCLLALAAFITLCLVTRTANAALTFRAALVSSVLLGWAGIAVYVCLLSPARARLSHLEGLAGKPSALREGRFFLAAGSFRIPKSVSVCSVRLESGEETFSLNLDEAWIPRAPANGSLVRVQTVRKFITGIEVLEPPEMPAPAGKKDSAPGKQLLRLLSRLVPLFILWLIVIPIFCGFVFTRITDTDAAHKVTVYVDAELHDAASLAALLEKSAPDPVRMVKVHPFTYALFGSDALKKADLYIVPASHAEEYRDWFAPLPEGLAAPASAEYPDGVTLFGPGSDPGSAGFFIRYIPVSGDQEPFLLFFGRNSAHLADRAAVDIANALLSPAD